MVTKLKRRYGLLMSICLVVGTVIGSGIFFRNDTIFAAIGGNMWIGIAAWVVGGLITLSLTWALAILATEHDDVDGLIGFAKKLVGERYAYIFGWYMTLIFFPAITGVLAWVSGRFTIELLGLEGVDPFFSAHTYLFALFYLVSIFVMNALTPKLAEKFHISCTFIKVVPLILMGIVGTAVGLTNGTSLANIGTNYVPTASGNVFFIALLATTFAYLGWDTVLAVSKEIINVKRNLPIALVVGMVSVIAIYVAFFVGLFSAAPVEQLTSGAGVMYGFTNIFSEVGGTVLFVFIIISCLGTLNGLIASGGRMFYNLAARKQGPAQEMLASVDRETLMPANSMILMLVCTGIWMMIFGANLAPELPNFRFDAPSLVPVSFMGLLIPIFVMMIIKEKQLGIFKRLISPLVAILGATFCIFAIFYVQRWAVVHFLIVFVLVTLLGLILNGKLSKK